MSRVSRSALRIQLLLLGVPLSVVFSVGAFFAAMFWLAGSSRSLTPLALAGALLWFGAAAGLLSFFSLSRTYLDHGSTGLRCRSGYAWVALAAGVLVAAIAGADLLRAPAEEYSPEATARSYLHQFALGLSLVPAALQLAFERFRIEV